MIEIKCFLAAWFTVWVFTVLFGDWFISDLGFRARYSILPSLARTATIAAVIAVWVWATP